MYKIISAVACLTATARAETMIRYLLSDHVDPRLSMSAVLASRMDYARLETLLAEARGGLVLVLPTNEGWQKFPSLYAAINDDSATANKFRADLMFAAGGEMNKVGGFEDLLAFAEENDGVVDTAYGTPIKVEEDGRVCSAEYDENWNIKTTECAQLQLPPLMFDDGALYLTDEIVLPDQLWTDVKSYIAQEGIAD